MRKNAATRSTAGDPGLSVPCKLDKVRGGIKDNSNVIQLKNILRLAQIFSLGTGSAQEIY